MHALLTLLLYRCCHFAIDVLDSSLLPTLNVVGIVVAKRSQRSRVVGVASSLRPLQIDARRVQNRPSEAPKSTLRGFKIDLRSPRQVKKRPRSVPAASKSVPRAPKSAPRAPKSAPRASQERPKSVPERPKSALESVKTPLKALRGALRDHFDAYKLEKRAFRERSVARLARESRSECFFVDFRSVRARANM